MSGFAAIDLGDGRVKVAIPDSNGNPATMPFSDGGLYLPSAIFFGSDGSVVYGLEAVNLGLAEPERLVIHWKRKMGTDEVLHRADDGTEYRARDIARLLLQEVARNFEARTGELLTKAAISVPAVYIDSKKEQTKQAGEALDIEVVCMPHEPTAALFGNKVHDRCDGLRAVIDVGSSTTDVSIGEKSGNNIAIRNTNGDPNLGGQDFSTKLREMLLDRFEQKHGFRPDPQKHPLAYQDLFQRIEQVKHSLSTRDQASVVINCEGHVFSTVVTREEFERITTDELKRVMDCVDQTLKEAGVLAETILEIIPVGGPSQMPMVADAIEKRFGKKPTCHCEPHFAVALGNVIAGRLKIELDGGVFESGGNKLPPLNLSARDVTTHPIGVAVLVDGNNGRLINAVVLDKGVPIPSDQTHPFTLAVPGQTDAKIEVLQGQDAAPYDECLLLGHFELTGMTPVFDRPHRVDVRLKFDHNGMLTASAYDPASGISADLEIDYAKTKVV